MHRRISFASIFALIAMLICIDYAGLNFTQLLNLRMGDVLLRKIAPSRLADPDIVILDIDQKSLEEMNEVASKWPWPRSIHAEMIEYLAAQHPKAIVFDVMFNEPDTFGTESDTLFRDTVAKYSNIYFAQTQLQDGNSTALKTLPRSVGLIATDKARADARAILMLPSVLDRNSWRGGLINFNANQDGIGRQYLIHSENQGWLIPSLPWRLALDLKWPEVKAAQIRINWQHQRQHISYSDVYLDANREKPLRPKQEFNNKIIIIGTAAPGLQDLRATPLSSTYPGVEVLATAIDNLKNNDWLRDTAKAPYAAIALILCALLLVGFRRGINTLWLAASLIMCTLIAALIMWLGLKQHYFLSLAAPIAWAWVYFWLAALISYLAEKASREHAVAMFSRFLDSRVVGELIASGEIDMNKKAESRELTVLFSDIRGFTTLSESHPPEYIVELLNRYFSMQVAIIFKHGGTLDKFIGDAIMAFWGAPAHDEHHAQHAIAAAIEMSEALVKFKEELKDIGAEFDVGIGIHSGPAVVGFIGSESRLDYTVIGDTVNLASRIEGLTKGVARILVSQASMQQCQSTFEFIDRGTHHVKGREQTVQLFEPQVKA
ncbi:adenylate/guanylate cyclase domain-containing protein [Chitinibacter bivalviorum]|uniref:Adenylate/guanylate cyclase domain-containing protein n=1 Tax=Chitinibacter bivalviorum TaxID=2739434 RepID=A0A7H9BFX7_9NEIS|nr:adenylate/guanylate cyclase domain-containing protein [Chitinibacter bivalviorum]QLG87497.1 adenylate/guanylate cyclase domain-containing protein [Chitinibacter bivalviorum]